MKLFPIMLEVEEPMLGTVLRIVKDLAGVAKLHLDLDGVAAKPVAKRKNTGRLLPDPSRAKAKDIIIRALMHGPKHLSEIRAELAKHGYTKESNASGNLSGLRGAGIAEAAPGAGMHKLTDKFMKSLAKHQMNGAALPQLPAPKKKEEPAKVKADVRKSRSDGPTGIAILLDICRKASPDAVPRAALRTAMVKGGLAPRSLDSVIGKAKARGFIKSPQTGAYAITEEGLKA